MKFKALLAAIILGSAFSLSAQNSGVEYYKAGQLTNAKELLTRSLSNGQDVAPSDYYLGLISIVEKNIPQAKKYFESGIAADAAYPYNYIGLGRLDLLDKNLKAAEAQFKAAEKLSKKDASLLIEIARAYYDADPVAYAKQIDKYVNNARKANMENVDIYLFDGDRKLDEKNVGGAASMYEMGANYNPQATEAYAKYADLYSYMNPDYAIQMLQKLLQNNPNSALGQHDLAEAYYNKNDFVNAAKAYGEYVKNPNHFKSDEDRYAFLLFYGGDFQKGYDYATNLVTANPDNFTARRYQFMNAAQLPDMAGKLLPMAEELFKRHNANPKDNKFASIDYMLISNEFQKDKRYDEAIDVLKEGVTEVPEQAPSFYKQIAQVYVDKNEITSASDAFNKAVAATAEPTYNDYIQQAVYYFYSGVENKNNATVAAEKYNLAQEAAKKAAEINPKGYRAIKIAGDVKKQRASAAEAKSAAVGDYEAAMALIMATDEPSKYAADAANMSIYLYNYYTEAKKTEDAKRVVNRMLQISPDNETFKKLL